MPVTSAAVTKAAVTRNAAASAGLAQLGITSSAGGPLGEVQLLGLGLIGVGLLDTGTGDSTNLLVSTQQAFSGLDWLSTNITAVDSVATDPLSGSTASTLTETTANATHFTSQAFYTAAADHQYTFVAILKQGLRTRAGLVVRDLQAPATNGAFCTYDLAGVQLGTAAGVFGAFTSPSATITSDANGFTICTLTFTTNGTGIYDVEIYPDAGSGTGASDLTYAGNASAPALTMWGTGVYAGATGTYVPQNANGGLAASAIQQVFSPNGGTTAYWGTQTPGAYVGFDAGVSVVVTRYRFAPRPSSATFLISPYIPDYALDIAGALVQTDVNDSTFATPTTVDTIPAAGTIPYYPRYWLNERTISGAAAARYIRFKPPSVSFGGLSEFQVFAKGGTSAHACPVQPVITPNGGRFPSLTTQVSMSSLTLAAKIYYTVGTVGSPPATPTTASTLYTAPFTQAVGSGAQVLIKAIAYDAALSTPTSLVTTSAPFNGYGFTPNDNWYDQSGNLIEAHSGNVAWDPNTSAYYWIGQFMNIASANIVGQTWNDPIGTPALYLYKGIPLDPLDPDGFLNWQNLGAILPMTPGRVGQSRIQFMYNALNNNYILFANPVDAAFNQKLFYASTSGSNIAGPWAWNLTPLISVTTFRDFGSFIDSDGITAYLIWRDSSTGTNIQQLNTSYTGFVGSPLALSGGTSREAPVLWKYPNVTGGTYYIITSELNAYNSASGEFDLRYITNTGSSPTANSWSASPASGASAWASDPVGGNYNGQPTFVFYPLGNTQPVIILDYWTGGSATTVNYGSRYIWQPLTMTGTTAQIGKVAAWNPSLLATTYSPATLTLSASTFIVGNAQGTVIGTVQGYLVESWVTLTNSNSGAVQLVAGVIQVGPTPPGSAGSFNIQLTETPSVGTPRVTTISITENAVGGALSGTVTTYTANQSINLTNLAVSGLSDWAAFGYNTNVSSIQRKATGGSKISALTQITAGGATFNNSNHTAVVPSFLYTWSDGSTSGGGTASVSGEGYVCYSLITGTAQVAGPGYSFTVPADTNSRTILVYVGVSYNAELVQGKLTATLSDASASPYVNTAVENNPGTATMLGLYTITYQAASASQTLTVSWINNNNPTSGFAQNVYISAVVIE